MEAPSADSPGAWDASAFHNRAIPARPSLALPCSGFDYWRTRGILLKLGELKCPRAWVH